jgi:hypothetical protein
MLSEGGNFTRYSAVDGLGSKPPLTSHSAF